LIDREGNPAVATVVVTIVSLVGFAMVLVLGAIIG
jgi:hypothetical protein